MAGWYGVNIQAPDNAGLIATAMKTNELAGQHYGNAIKGLGSIISNSIEQERQTQKEIQAANANMLNTLASARDREIKDLERQELKDKTLATNNALAILMDPNKATSLHTSASELTTQNQINMYNKANSDGVVTPQEQALIDSKYKEDLTRDISSNKSVDQSVIFNAQKQKEDMGLKQQQLDADIAYQNESLALERYKINQVLKKENKESKQFADYLKSIASNPTQVLVPGSTTQGITNQGEIDNYVNNLTASSNQYNQIVKDYMDKGTLDLDLGYKSNPGSSIKIPIKKTISGKELENYAHEQALKQAFGSYDFSKAPQAQYGEIKGEDKYVPKTKDQLIEDRLRILMNSNLPASTMKSEYEKLVPTIVGPKSQKEQLEIQKLEAEILKREAETKKVLAEVGANKKDKDVPKNIGQTTASTIGGSDAEALIKQLDVISQANKIPAAELYNILDQANNRAIETGLFDDVSEDGHKNFIKNELWRKYKIELK